MAMIQVPVESTVNGGVARHEMRQIGGVAVVDAGQHPAVRGRPVAAASSGRTVPSVSQARRSGGNRSAQPRRRARLGEPPFGRPPEMGVRTQRGDLGRLHARQPPGPVLRQRQDVGRPREERRERPLLPVELGAQAQAQRQHRRAGERRTGRAPPPARPRARQGRDARSPAPAGPAPRRPSARPPPRAPPARCSRSARWPRSRAAPRPPTPRSRRDRAAGRVARAGRRRRATLRQDLAGLVEQEQLGVGLADVEHRDRHRLARQEGRAPGPPRRLRSRSRRCSSCRRRTAPPAGSRCR